MSKPIEIILLPEAQKFADKIEKSEMIKEKYFKGLI